jgi:hypothetical protein
LRSILEAGAERLRAEGYRVVTLNFVVPVDSLKVAEFGVIPTHALHLLHIINNEIRAAFSGVVRRKNKKHKKEK